MAPFRSSILVLGALAALTLSGCEPPEPSVFGVPQSQWNTLNDQQRNQVIAGYNQQQQQKAVNEPWIAAIGAASGLLANSCHGHTKSKGSSTTTSHTHELPNGWETKSKTKSSGFSFSSPC